MPPPPIGAEVVPLPGKAADAAKALQKMGLKVLHVGATSVSVQAPEAVWRERFAGSPEVLGRRIEIDGESHTVVGVMPEGFHLPGLPDDRLWPVLQLPEPDARAPFYLWPIARLAPGASAAQARAQLEALAPEVKRRYPGSPPGWSYRLEDLKETVVRETVAARTETTERTERIQDTVRREELDVEGDGEVVTTGEHRATSRTPDSEREQSRRG